jgi:arylformamidase
MTDWDDAFDNVSHVPNALSYFDVWSARAQVFRDGCFKAELGLAYGELAREKIDLFFPETKTGSKPAGLVIFIHGGYWMRLDRSFFSDLARGSLENGWVVAMPSYTLAPEARISEITLQVARAIEFSAAKISGPICLAGHSAGGHLAARMLCQDSALSAATQVRIQNTLTISGVHDLRNLRKTKLNQILKLSKAEAETESVCLCQPLESAKIRCWVGADERPEFIRQSKLLHQVWGESGANISLEIAAGKHHFNVCDALKDPDSRMTQMLLQYRK